MKKICLVMCFILSAICAPVWAQTDLAVNLEEAMKLISKAYTEADTQAKNGPGKATEAFLNSMINLELNKALSMIYFDDAAHKKITEQSEYKKEADKIRQSVKVLSVQLNDTPALATKAVVIVGESKQQALPLALTKVNGSWKIDGTTSIGVLATIALPNFRKAKQVARTKACHSNMRVLTGAIEMYNMDNVKGIDSIEPDTISKLLKGGYLRNYVQCPDGGTYSGKNLTTDGAVSCSIHGQFGD